jgi:hypothetical protein
MLAVFKTLVLLWLASSTLAIFTLAKLVAGLPSEA